MAEDGNNFNSRIEGDITMRIMRLAGELPPHEAQPGQYNAVLEAMHKYPPTFNMVAVGNRPQVVPAEPWKLAILTISTIHARLWDIAKPHWRASVADGGYLDEIFDLQRELDVEENHWREMLGLPTVDSQS
jgi:hypothetical protein